MSSARVAPTRIRWDRLGRISLLVVLAMVAGLYVSHTISLLAAKQRSDHARAVVRSLISANARLEREQRSLTLPSTITAEARRLGMVKVGEHPYVLTGS
jgi:hypothetical protein